MEQSNPIIDGRTAADGFSSSSRQLPITRWNGACFQETIDAVVVEEPLQIRINGENLLVTMRTPGDDFELAAGFLITEGIIQYESEILSMEYCLEEESEAAGNTVNVYLEPGWKDDSYAERRFDSTSSCGICGKASLESVRRIIGPLPDDGFHTSPAVIRTLPDTMRAAQRAFQRTGGLHAAGLFDPDGELLALREDVGRHNAVDKLIGAELLADHLPLSQRIMMVSGRTSFEILQKTAAARIPILCAVSAPSSLAVDLAVELNITLVGFLRGETMNVYAGAWRLVEWNSR